MAAPEIVRTGVVGYGLARPTLVPKHRYVSDAFAALEHERLWPRVWQLACSVDHVAKSGDYFEYRTGPLSVLIVRGHDDELRAFQNVCRHRGNSLCQGTGGGLDELRCPFHRWTWDLTGTLREVPSRKSFGPGLRNEDFPLISAQVDTWGPFVFVNLDLGAPPLADFLEGVPDDSAWARLDEFRCQVMAVTPVESNWKVVAEGFSETYHIQGIHPELLGSLDDVNAPQRVWGRHAVSYQHYGVCSPRLGRDATDRTVWTSFAATQPDRLGVARRPDGLAPAVPPGQTMRDVIAACIRSHQASFGVDLSEFSTAQLLDLAQYNLFPNATVLVTADEITVITARPGPSPDQADMTLFFCHRRPDAGTPRRRPRDVLVRPGGDIGTVFNQDVAMLRTAQRGLRQPGLTHIVLSSEEVRILNFHRNLEDVLGIDETELRPLDGEGRP